MTKVSATAPYQHTWRHNISFFYLLCDGPPRRRALSRAAPRCRINAHAALATAPCAPRRAARLSRRRATRALRARDKCALINCACLYEKARGEEEDYPDIQDQHPGQADGRGSGGRRCANGYLACRGGEENIGEQPL